jgi:hypothetical protein
MTITRSPGTPITRGGQPTGYVAGGGYSGADEDLDATVAQAAELLAAAYNMDVTIRFNSDRQSGGAFLKTHEVDAVGRNSEVGINAGRRRTRDALERTAARYGLTVEEWCTPEEIADADGSLYVAVYLSATSLTDPSLANSGGSRPYLHMQMPDVETAVEYALAQAPAPVVDGASH